MAEESKIIYDKSNLKVLGRISYDAAIGILMAGWTTEEDREVFEAVRTHFYNEAAKARKELIKNLPCSKCGK